LLPVLGANQGVEPADRLPAVPQSPRLDQGLQGKKPRLPDPNHRTRPELAVELIRLVASWFPERKLLVTGDSAYGGQSVLKKLPENVDLISHVHPKDAEMVPATVSPPRLP
jgi:hypothetical protein